MASTVLRFRLAPCTTHCLLRSQNSPRSYVLPPIGDFCAAPTIVKVDFNTTHHCIGTLFLAHCDRRPGTLNIQDFYSLTVAAQLAVYNGVVLSWREKVRLVGQEIHSGCTASITKNDNTRCSSMFAIQSYTG